MHQNLHPQGPSYMMRQDINRPSRPYAPMPQGFNNPEHVAMEQQPGYGLPPTPIIQQGIVYQAVPVHPQGMMHYPPHSHQSVQFPQMDSGNYPISNRGHADSDQIHLVNPHNQAYMVENRINTGFSCYTCLVYTGLMFTIVGVLSAFLHPNKPHGVAIASVIIALGFLAGYILAIRAKSTYDSKKQHYAFIMFCIMTVVKVLLGFVLFRTLEREMAGSQPVHYSRPSQIESRHPPRNEMDIIGAVVVIGILVELVLNLLLVHYSRSLSRLMKERELLLNNFRPINNMA